MPIHAAPRRRATLALATVAVIALGLASRKWPWLFPASLGKYPGDALWALMVFLGMAWLMNRAPTARLVAVALAFSFGIEASQLYHASWLDAWRATAIGHLVLGSGFDWVDLVAYTVGILLGALGDRTLPRRGVGAPSDRSKASG